MQVDFYQLGRTTVERVLAQIATRVVAGDGRLLIVAGDEAQAAAIDQGLWTASADSFLPHGRASDADAGADQPVLIAGTCEAVNGARTVALADGLWRDAALGFDRALFMFDDATLEGARAAWRALNGREETVRNYWTQDDAGRWTKTA